jgi:hypothetical protein
VFGFKKRKEYWQYLKGKFCKKYIGPVKENELWRIRLNDELEDIIKGENIVRFINL